MGAYKDRELYEDDYVQVYRNLNNGKFSIKNKKDNKVVAHADTVTLRDCKFIVSQAGQKRAREKKQRNVHAYIEGFFVVTDEQIDKDRKFNVVTYNPFKHDTFISIYNFEPIHNAQVAHCQQGKVYIL